MATSEVSVFFSTQDSVTESGVLSSTQDPASDDVQLANIITIIVAIVLLPMVIIGNLIVIIAIIVEMRNGRRGKPFILSLAAADVLIGILVAPVYVQFTIKGHWTLGRTLCNAWLIADWSLVPISQLNIFLITFDRYLRVTHPFVYQKWVTPGRTDAVICLSWILPFIFYPVFILALKPDEYVYVDDVCEVPIMTVPWVSITYGALQYWSPVFLMVFFYIRTYKASINLVRRRNSVRRSLMKISFILGSYILFSSPFAIIVVLLPFCGDITCVPGPLYQICYGLYYVNSALNPFLYAGIDPTLWHAMKNVIYCRWI